MFAYSRVKGKRDCLVRNAKQLDNIISWELRCKKTALNHISMPTPKHMPHVNDIHCLCITPTF